MTNTIPNVPRELLERASNLAFQTQHYPLHEELLNLLSAPSPAGVEGCKCSMSISMLGDGCRHCQPQEYIDRLSEMLDEERAELSDAQAIIDGLRGEVAGLRKRAKTAEREAGSALRTYKGLEKVARVVSDNSDQVCGELNVLRQQFDQQAQRIGELEGLLRESGKTIHKLQAEQPTPARIARYLDAMRGQIDAALSAGKEGE